jgi:uncharacterized protein
MTRLSEHVDTVPFIDHHVHGCGLQPVDRRGFEDSLNEANVEPLVEFDSAFGTQLGFAVRAHCALLGLPRHHQLSGRAVNGVHRSPAGDGAIPQDRVLV